ncbi:MAG TPA: YceI family protein [Steroidobacteraceae bacterium]
MTLSHNLWFGSIVALAAASGVATAADFNVVEVTQSKISFHYTEMGVGIGGGFSKFSAQLSFDPTKAEAAHISLDVQLSSVDAGAAEANEEIPGKEWLDTQHFPVAHFESVAVKSLGADKFQVTGNLSIKGHVHAITVPVSFASRVNQGQFDGSFSFNRIDYGIGEGEWADLSVIANPIQVTFKLLATAGK